MKTEHHYVKDYEDDFEDADEPQTPAVAAVKSTTKTIQSKTSKQNAAEVDTIRAALAAENAAAKEGSTGSAKKVAEDSRSPPPEARGKANQMDVN